MSKRSVWRWWASWRTGRPRWRRAGARAGRDPAGSFAPGRLQGLDVARAIRGKGSPCGSWSSRREPTGRLSSRPSSRGGWIPREDLRGSGDRGRAESGRWRRAHLHTGPDARSRRRVRPPSEAGASEDRRQPNLSAREIEVLEHAARGSTSARSRRAPGALAQDGRDAPRQRLPQARRPQPRPGAGPCLRAGADPDRLSETADGSAAALCRGVAQRSPRRPSRAPRRAAVASPRCPACRVRRGMPWAVCPCRTRRLTASCTEMTGRRGLIGAWHRYPLVCSPTDLAVRGGALRACTCRCPTASVDPRVDAVALRASLDERRDAGERHVQGRLPGEPGAYSERAVAALFPSAQPLPCETIRLTFSRVTSGEADFGVVPVENSQAAR